MSAFDQFIKEFSELKGQLHEFMKNSRDDNASHGEALKDIYKRLSLLPCADHKGVATQIRVIWGLLVVMVAAMIGFAFKT